MATTITARDYSALDGGGHAVLHMSACRELDQRPTIADILVSDIDLRTADAAQAEEFFAAMWTVPVPVRRCPCVDIHEQEQAVRDAASAA